MRGKLLFIVGAAAGYVVGARQGRQAYVNLKARAGELWNAPAVQSSVESAREFVKDNVPVVGEKVSKLGKRASSAVSERITGGSGDDAGGGNSPSGTSDDPAAGDARRDG